MFESIALRYIGDPLSNVFTNVNAATLKIDMLSGAVPLSSSFSPFILLLSLDRNRPITPGNVRLRDVEVKPSVLQDLLDLPVTVVCGKLLSFSTFANSAI